MIRPFIILAAMCLSACPSAPYTPPPVPPDPAPVDPPNPQPEPGPAPTSPCERAFARSVELGCGYDAQGFAIACGAFSDLDTAGGEAGWDLECMANAPGPGCAAFERCRETGTE